MQRRSRNPERRSHIHDEGIPATAFSPSSHHHRSSPQPQQQHQHATPETDPQYPGDASLERDDAASAQRSAMRQQLKRYQQQQQQQSSPLDAPVSPEEWRRYKEQKAKQWLHQMPARVRHFVSTAQSDITMRIFREVVVRVPMKGCSAEEVLSLLEPFGSVEYVSAVECTGTQTVRGGSGSATAQQQDRRVSGALIDTEGDAYCHLARFDEGLDALHCFFALNGAVIDPKTHQHLRDEIATMLDQGLGESEEEEQEDESDEGEEGEEEGHGDEDDDQHEKKKSQAKKKKSKTKKSLDERRRDRGDLKKELLNSMPLIEAADDTRFIIVTVDFFRIAILPRSKEGHPEVCCKPRCAMASSAASSQRKSAEGTRMGLPSLCKRLRLRALGLAHQLPVVQSYSSSTARANEDWQTYARCVAVYAFLHECLEFYEWDACFESLKRCVQSHNTRVNSYYATSSPFAILSDRVESWRGEGEIAVKGATKNKLYYLKHRLSFWPLSREAKQLIFLLLLLVVLSVVLYVWVQ